MAFGSVSVAPHRSKMTKLIPIALGVMAAAVTAFIAFIYYKKKKEENDNEKESMPPLSSLKASSTAQNSPEVSKTRQDQPEASLAAQGLSSVFAQIPSLPFIKVQEPSKLSVTVDSSKASANVQNHIKSPITTSGFSKTSTTEQEPLKTSATAEETAEDQAKTPVTAQSPSKTSVPTPTIKASEQVSSKIPVSAQVHSRPSAATQEPFTTFEIAQDQSKTPVKAQGSSKTSPTAQSPLKTSVTAQDKSKVSASAKDSSEPPLTLQDPSKKYQLQLIDKKILSHDSRRFRFALPSPDHILGLPVGQHVYLSATVDGKMVIRAYTPVSSKDEKGHMDLVIKVYFKNVSAEFPTGGKFSQYLESLKINDFVDVRGPTGSMLYRGNGVFEIQTNKKQPPTEYRVKRVGMIAGGTGITPMYQLLQHCLKCPKDQTQFSLVFSNRLEEDILLRAELEEMAAKNPTRFQLCYTLTKPPAEGWKFSSGRVDAELIVAHLPAPADDVIILMCGPDSMINCTCLPILKNLGYKNHYTY